MRFRSLAGPEQRLFNLTSVAHAHPVDVITRTMCLVLAATLAVARGPSPANAAPSVCAEDLPKPAGAAALKPADVLLAISDPRAGETITEVAPDESVTVAVDYWGPQLVAANAGGAVDQYHLAYFLDEDATPYIGTLMPIPHCNPHIQHTVATRVTFDKVPHGGHALAVVLTGRNNVSVNPPVALRETFMVR